MIESYHAFHCSTTETIERLVIVADDAEIACIVSECEVDDLLDWVCVLILVDNDMSDSRVDLWF